MSSSLDESSLLAQIATPSDLRRLPISRLPAVARELRSFLVRSVSRSGGHFAANLGTIELTVALHYLFDTPHDRLVWDVGHQTYPHKILTGRRGAIGTIRKLDGLAPFPKRDESPFDAFGVGHAGTSVGAALGMALASQARSEQRRVVAVIGDGALTAGMAYEALNHAGDVKANLLIILNDNEMSISPNVGAISQSLTRLLSSHGYLRLREAGKRVLQHIPPVHELARLTEDQVRNVFVPGALFEEMGVKYFGPVDGHDLPGLLDVLSNLRDPAGPRLLHVVTRKGKGYGPAEANPVTYHGVKPFDPAIGLPSSNKSAGTPVPKSYTEVFSQWLCDTASRDERLMAITPAMREGSGLVEFSERFAERYFDVGIAEQHAVTLAAGMACEGMRPVVAIYSTFLQRAYDQLIHDVAIQGLPVLFAIDRAGLVGPDGSTHAGAFDLAFLRCVPNMVVMAPANENECRRMLETGFALDSPSAVRYPRGKGPGVAVERHGGPECGPIEVGRGRMCRQGQGEVAILSFGSLLDRCQTVAERLDASVADMRFVKPLDVDLIAELAQRHDLLVTVEDNALMGGAGSAVAEVLAETGVAGAATSQAGIGQAVRPVSLLRLGLADAFLEHGERDELLAQAGLDVAGIEARIQAALDGLLANRRQGEHGGPRAHLAQTGRA